MAKNLGIIFTPCDPPPQQTASVGRKSHVNLHHLCLSTVGISAAVRKSNHWWLQPEQTHTADKALANSADIGAWKGCEPQEQTRHHTENPLSRPCCADGAREMERSHSSGSQNQSLNPQTQLNYTAPDLGGIFPFRFQILWYFPFFLQTSNRPEIPLAPSLLPHQVMPNTALNTATGHCIKTNAVRGKAASVMLKREPRDTFIKLSKKPVPKYDLITPDTGHKRIRSC